MEIHYSIRSLCFFIGKRGRKKHTSSVIPRLTHTLFPAFSVPEDFRFQAPTRQRKKILG